VESELSYNEQGLRQEVGKHKVCRIVRRLMEINLILQTHKGWSIYFPEMCLHHDLWGKQ